MALSLNSKSEISVESNTDTNYSPLLWIWDGFCHVIDNHGDLGVCWRLSQDLARLGHTVRLYIDHPEDLNWMAPQWAQPNGQAPTHRGVSVHAWPHETQSATLAHVVIEAFGCELPPRYLANLAKQASSTPSTPVAWINLDYMSAEAFYQNIHRMPSPQLWGPAQGLTKWFYQPGFTPDSGGLLRPHPAPSPELNAVTQVAHVAASSPSADSSAPLKCVLFCYEPPALKDLLLQLSQSSTPVLLQVAPGRATRHTLQCIQTLWRTRLQAQDKSPSEVQTPGQRAQFGNLSLEFLPYMDQFEFDQLLAQSSLNFVRGEDSLVQAIWAQRPFVWQIYPQDDGAHGPKLEAFLGTLQAPLSLQRFMRVWNGLSTQELPAMDPDMMKEWQLWSQEYAKRMQKVPHLTQELVLFTQQIMASPQNHS